MAAKGSHISHAWRLAAAISSAYGLAAGVWIYASDALLAWQTGQSGHAILPQTYKGWLFVVITALLLYGFIGNFLAAAGADAGGVAPAVGTRRSRSFWKGAGALILIFLLLNGLTAGVGYLAYIRQKQALQKATADELRTITSHKAAEIEHWLAERRGDAEFIARDPFLAQAVQGWLERGAPDDADGDRLRHWLAELQATFGYAGVMVVDGEARVRLGGGVAQLPPAEQQLARRALAEGRPLLSDLHWRQEVGGPIDLDLIAPLRRDPAAPARPPALLWFKIDPAQYLYPLIQRWPTPSPSAESMLARRDGDAVLYLNDLRHLPDAALRVRLPLTQARLPAALAVNGGWSGALEGLDYRAAPVLATSQALTGVDWFLITKIDADEVYAPLRALARLVAMMVGILMATAGVGALLWWRRQYAGFTAERDRGEQERRALVQHFDYLTKYANDIVLLMDAEGRLLEANVRATRAYGYSYDELRRLNIRDLRAVETHGLVAAQMAQAARPEGLVFETVHRRKDGGCFPVEVSSHRIEIAGQPFLHSIIRDITERKRMEEELRESAARLRAIVNAVPDVLLVLDDQGRYLEILTARPELLYTDPAALKGKRIQDMLPAELARRVLTMIGQTLATGRIQTIEYELHIGAVGKRYFEARAAPVEAPLEGRPAVAVLTRDISRHRLAEETLRQTQKMDTIGQLTGGVAHDFNNLLGIILGNLDLLLEALPQPELKELAQRSLDAAERGAALIQRLLAFARRQPLRAGRVDLNQLIVGMLDLLRRTLGETIEIETRLDADPAWTVIDRGQFETALLNLALNARDAMPAGGRLTLETANARLDQDDPAVLNGLVEPGSYIRLAVGDTGQGMSPQVLEHAFEPFFTTKEQGKGSGLGLSMVYGLVKQSGGYIHLDSAVNRGTTIYMYLPVEPLEQADPVERAEPITAPPRPREASTILVVEDDPGVRRLAVHMLHALGYRTIEAETAAAALDALESNSETVLLFTDMVLPGGMNGAELAAEARRRRPDLKMLFTSGYSEQPLTAGRRQEGGEWLSKPYRQGELAAKLHALLGADASTA